MEDFRLRFMARDKAAKAPPPPPGARWGPLRSLLNTSSADRWKVEYSIDWRNPQTGLVERIFSTAQSPASLKDMKVTMGGDSPIPRDASPSCVLRLHCLRHEPNVTSF